MESTTTSSGNGKLSSSFIISGVLTLAMLATAWQRNSSAELLLALPVSLLVYTLLFSVGTESLAQRLGQWCRYNLERALALPALLVALLYLYVYLGHGTPLQGNSWQIPLLFCAPALFYRLAVGSEAAITWKDSIGFILCVLPYALHDYPFNTKLPPGGGGIEDLYLTLAIIVAVYSLVVVRRLLSVGFVVYFSLSALRLVLKWWAVFFALVLAVGVPTGLLKWVGYEPFTPSVLISALGVLLRTYFGTAIPEELIFRGAFLNLLYQRIKQTGNWHRYLYGALLLLPLAVVAGYTTEDKAQWFPLLIAALLWALTYWLNKRQPDQAPFYSAQLIVSTIFGLAHYHVHSTLFIGLAMIAGWIYAHVYQRTGSVFYSALAHTLVNTTPALFGLLLVR